MYIKRIFGINNAPQVHTYRGFGSKASVVVLGRVTQSQKSQKRTSETSSLLHAVRLIRSYLASPLPDVEVTVHFGGSTTTTKTNASGIFKAHLTPTDLSYEQGCEWVNARVHLSSLPEETACEAPVLVEGSGNTYGVISDIDDTVLISNATRKLKLLYATIFKSPGQRTPFLGVTELYRAFVEGSDGISSNPIFYVSSSHWNLYSFLVSFFNQNEIPRGPLLLKRTTSLLSTVTTVGKHDQKHEAITTILETYPKLNFILIGDSGQKDAEIYTEIAEEFPGRIKVIYIRDITVREYALVEEDIETLSKTVELIEAKTSAEIAAHAQKNSYITKEAERAVASLVKETH